MPSRLNAHINTLREFLISWKNSASTDIEKDILSRIEGILQVQETSPLRYHQYLEVFKKKPEARQECIRKLIGEENENLLVNFLKTLPDTAYTILINRMRTSLEYLEKIENESFIDTFPNYLYPHTIDEWSTLPDANNSQKLKSGTVLSLSKIPILPKNPEKREILRNLLGNIQTLQVKTSNLTDWDEWIDFMSWLHVRVLEFESQINDKDFSAVKKMLSICKDPVHLTMNTSVFTNISNEESESFFQACLPLRSLYLHKIETNSIDNILPYLARLQNIESLKLNYDNLNTILNQQLSECISQFSKLKALEIDINLTSLWKETEVISYLLSATPLNSLLIKWLNLSKISQGLMKEIFTQQHLLKYLSLEGMMVYNNKDLWEEMCDSFPPNLVSLSIAWSGFVSGEIHLLLLKDKLQHLVHLDVSHCYRLNEFSTIKWEEFLEWMPNLTSLTLSGISLWKWSLAHFQSIKKLPNLKHLNISNANLANFPTEDLPKLSACFSHLKILTMHWETNKFENLSATKAFFQELWNLERINVPYNMRDTIKELIPEIADVIY